MKNKIIFAIIGLCVGINAYAAAWSKPRGEAYAKKMIIKRDAKQTPPPPSASGNFKKRPKPQSPDPRCVPGVG